MQNTVAVYQLINAQLEQPLPGQDPKTLCAEHDAWQCGMMDCPVGQ